MPAELEHPVPYFHLTACANGGIADLDANFARNIYKQARKRAQADTGDSKKGFISYHIDWGKDDKLLKEGGIYYKPGKPYLV